MATTSRTRLPAEVRWSGPQPDAQDGHLFGVTFTAADEAEQAVEDALSEFRRRGRTILLVTHSLGLVEKMADEALWIDRSRMQMRGDPKKVVDAYLAQVTQHEEDALAAAEAKTAAEFETALTPNGGEASEVEPTLAALLARASRVIDRGIVLESALI